MVILCRFALLWSAFIITIIYLVLIRLYYIRNVHRQDYNHAKTDDPCEVNEEQNMFFSILFCEIMKIVGHNEEENDDFNYY